MDISSSGRLYLKNYYILELSRKDAHQYLESIALAFSSRVEERLQKMDDSFVTFRKYVQKDGGFVQFIAEYKSDRVLPVLEQLGALKFYIEYIDAMRNDSLPSPTTYVVEGFSPKLSAHLINEFQRAAQQLGFPDPYEKICGEHLESSFEDTVDLLEKIIFERITQAIGILEFLAKEGLV